MTIELAAPLVEITECNCSLCRSYGVRWAYYPAEQVTISTPSTTDTYAWNARNFDFHR